MSVFRLPYDTAYIQNNHVHNNETMKSQYLTTNIHETFLFNTLYLYTAYTS